MYPKKVMTSEEKKASRRKSRRKWKRRNPLRWKAQILAGALRRLGIPMAVDDVIEWIKRTPVCTYCGKPIGIKDYSLDHITPRSRGGADALDNLHLVCDSCNLMKGNLLDREFRDLLAYLKDKPAVYAMLKKRLKASGFMYR